MPCAGDEEKFALATARCLQQPFGQRRRHAPIRAAGNKQDGRVDLANSGFNIPIISVKAHTKFSTCNDEV